MSKPLIYILLSLLGALVAFILIGDLIKNDIKKPTKNPYAFDISEYEFVDPSLIQYKELKRIKLNEAGPKAINYKNGRLALGFENQLQVIDTSGREIFRNPIKKPATAIFISDSNLIYLACKTYLEVYEMSGNLIESWPEIDSVAFITSIARKDNWLFVANASKPEIIRYNTKGEISLRFDGKNQELNEYGFIIPSPYFDVNVDPYNELWISNTGMQHIQNYTSDGKLRAFWGGNGYDLEDFTGCCNPAHFSILSDGSFVTCEKGLVRIKVHKPSGELDAFVAPPQAFAKNSEPLDLTSDEFDNVYALDITQRMIRKFKRL